MRTNQRHIASRTVGQRDLPPPTGYCELDAAKATDARMVKAVEGMLGNTGNRLLADQPTVTWAEAARLPLCLLTPDMQNRRIIDRHLAEAGVVAAPTVEANSMMLLYMHVRTGEWASIIPSRFAESLDRPAGLRAIPLVEPDVTHKIGLIVPGREPFAPLIAALHEVGFEIAVETNGTLAAPAGIDWICVSPKANTDLVQRVGHELKLVFPQAGAEPARYESLAFTHFFLQPMDSPARDANTSAAIDFCLAHPCWRLSLQTHKLLGLR